MVRVVKTDPYSRLIAWLKVILPLVSLAILSTLFLLSRNVDPGDSIPFAEGEITERIRGQQVTGPFFSGATATGDRISFTAAEVVSGEGSTSVAHDLASRIDFANGGSLTMVAETGVFNVPDDTADLAGGILLHSSTGYVMRSDSLTARLSRLEIEIPTEVTARGPAGRLTAGALRIEASETRQNTQLLFTKGVKLIYDPKDTDK